MSDPYTHQGVGRMFPGSLGGRSRVASSVSPVQRQKFTYPAPALTGPVVSVVATATLSGTPFGHIVWGSGRFAVFTWTAIDSGGDGHLRYELWDAIGSSLSSVSVTDLGLIAFYAVRLSASGTTGIVMYNNTVAGGTYGRGLTCSSSGASIEAGAGGSFGFADNGGWVAFSDTRFFGPRNDGDCIVATKESGSWSWESTRPVGWAVNSRRFHASLSLSSTEFLSIYYHVAASEERAAVLTVDTSAHPFTITPGTETAIPIGSFGTFWPNRLEPIGLRLGTRSVYVTDEAGSAVLTANGSVAVSDTRTVHPPWFGYGGRESADRWLATVTDGLGGLADVRYSGGAFSYDSTLVAHDPSPSVYDIFKVNTNLFVNLYLNTLAFESLTWPHHT